MNKTLLIMAAGMGSRFGGLKQIEPVGPNGEFIIDYSIYDAIQAGFNKVVFVIKEENYGIFKETIGKRVEDKIKVEYAFQDMNALPDGFKRPEERTKPWGTAHAILAAKGIINEPFVALNADDFYGRDAYMKLSEFINKEQNQNNYAMAGYIIENTMTENGSVKRGICEVKDGMLVDLTESVVERVSDNIIASPLDGSESFTVTKDTVVSMNMFAFFPSLFEFLEVRLKEFLDENKEDILKCEFLIPDEIKKAVNKGIYTMKVLDTTAVWHGVTYKEDKDSVVEAINNLIKSGEYKERLWD